MIGKRYYRQKFSQLGLRINALFLITLSAVDGVLLVCMLIITAIDINVTVETINLNFLADIFETQKKEIC